MTDEFDHTRAAFSSSRPARVIGTTRQIATKAWHRSTMKRALHRLGGGLHTTPSRDLIRMAAVALAVAAGLQPLLMWMMPLTVRPAIPPYVFVAIALLAAVAAWRSAAVVTAWPSSLVARRLRR